jgi:hypothetical protein
MKPEAVAYVHWGAGALQRQVQGVAPLSEDRFGRDHPGSELGRLAIHRCDHVAHLETRTGSRRLSIDLCNGSVAAAFRTDGETRVANLVAHNEARLLEERGAFFGCRSTDGTDPDTRRRGSLRVHKFGLNLPKAVRCRGGQQRSQETTSKTGHHNLPSPVGHTQLDAVLACHANEWGSGDCLFHMVRAFAKDCVSENLESLRASRRLES